MCYAIDNNKNDACIQKTPLLGGQLGQSRRGGSAPGLGRDACCELNYIDKALPHDGAIVDGALALHGAVCIVLMIVADVVGLPVVGAGDGGGLALDLPLQLEELVGVQAHDARVGGDLGGVLVVERAEHARRDVCCRRDAPKGRRRGDAKERLMVMVILAVLVGRTGSALVFMEDLQLH